MDLRRGDIYDLQLSDDEDFLELVEMELFPRALRVFRVRENHFIKWDDNEFRTRFRLSKETVQIILEEIRDAISFTKNETTALSAQERLLLTLRYLATGSILQVIGDFGGIDKSTASRLIYQVITSIANLRQQFIKMPETQEDIEKNKQGFFSISRFPRCIGALDCTHVKIQSPGGDNAEIYRNRKGFFSFNVQCVCSYDLKIQDVVCRWPGSAHDSTIFNNSRLRARMENGDFGNGSILLGDGGYPIRSYLITPLRNPQSPAEHLFNRCQIRTRNPIERCFGVLKRRFPVLALGIRLDVNKVEAIVVACAVLHNIACQQGEPDVIVNDEVQAAIQEANDINLEIPPAIRGFNMNNVARYNLIQQYFQNQL